LTTNNRMELTAVIEGLKLLRRPAQVEVYSDSRYVVQGMTEWIEGWIRKGWRTAAKKPVLNEELWRRLAELARRQKGIRFHWVRAHAGHPENEHCDELAVRAYRALLKKRR